MMNDNFELSGESELAHDCQLTDWQQLVGHTIKAAIAYPTGKRDVGAVIVTQTGCWLAIDADGGSCDEKPTVEIDKAWAGNPQDIPREDYLSAHDMFHTGLINKPTFDLLLEKEKAAREAEKRAKIERLQREIERVEKGLP